MESLSYFLGRRRVSFYYSVCKAQKFSLGKVINILPQEYKFGLNNKLESSWAFRTGELDTL